MKKLIYFSAFFLIFIFSCKKDEEPNHNPCGASTGGTYLIHPDILNYQFKTGSYWIFHDSINGVSDSVFINSFDQGYESDICGNSFQFYSFMTNTNPSLLTTNYRLENGTFNKGATSLLSGVTIYFENNQLPSGLSAYYAVSHFDSLYIYDQYYYNVSCTTRFKDPTENDNRCVNYLNPEFGFLRVDIIDTTNTTISKKLLTRKFIVR